MHWLLESLRSPRPSSQSPGSRSPATSSITAPPPYLSVQVLARIDRDIEFFRSEYGLTFEQARERIAHGR